jgi:hypothetical protein
VNLRLAHPPVMVHVGEISPALRRRFSARAIEQEIPSSGRFRVQDVELIQNAATCFIDAAQRASLCFHPGAQERFGRAKKK